MPKINCDGCGRFISKKDLDDGKCGSEDVGDGYEYNGEIWIFTCPTCNGYSSDINTVAYMSMEEGY